MKTERNFIDNREAKKSCKRRNERQRKKKFRGKVLQKDQIFLMYAQIDREGQDKEKEKGKFTTTKNRRSKSGEGRERERERKIDR